MEKKIIGILLIAIIAVVFTIGYGYSTLNQPNPKYACTNTHTNSYADTE